jgi:DNA-binding NarL/FixJ family response regulator
MQTNSIIYLTLNQSIPQTDKRPLHILIADDHAIVRIGLMILIRQMDSDIIMEEASDGESVIRKLLFAKRFLKLGAHGYMIKQSREPEIKLAIEKILNGNVYVSDMLAEIISNDLIRQKETNPFEDLSDREFEVLLQILKGYSVSEIAEILHLNKSTVGTHKSRILHKLKLTNSLQLLSLAGQYNLL